MLGAETLVTTVVALVGGVNILVVVDETLVEGVKINVGWMETVAGLAAELFTAVVEFVEDAGAWTLCTIGTEMLLTTGAGFCRRS